MNSSRRLVLVVVSVAMAVATLGCLLLPEVKGTPAVLLPSVVAVVLAFATREIYSSLFLGALAGAFLLRGGNPFLAFIDLFAKHMIPALADRWNVSVLMFSLMMGGFVELLHRNGSMRALATVVLGRGQSARRAGLGAFGLGWLIFFDGLTNAMLVGKTMRPIAERARLSREKLAFIVDSTSSPIASFALVSTWIATEMALIRSGFENVGDVQLLAEVSPYQLLLSSLPFRFYGYFVLLIVFLTIWLGRDIGPMAGAEQRARAASDLEDAAKDEEPAAEPWRIWLGAIPLVVLVFGVFGGMFVTGGGLEGPLTLRGVITAIGSAPADLVFICACGFAIVAAMLGSACKPTEAMRQRGESVLTIFFNGMQQMFLPVIILVFAWTLNGVIKQMETAQWLVGVLGDTMPAGLLPASVFLLAALVSFSTGTSWGTMGILMPLTLPVAVSLSGMHAGMPAGPVVIATIGAVLAGSVFGDHCSPISDTTIVSAFASGCDAMDHVRTQMPYALLAAGVALIFGYLPAGFGVWPVILLAAGAAACWAIIRYRGVAADGQ